LARSLEVGYVFFHAAIVARQPFKQHHRLRVPPAYAATRVRLPIPLPTVAFEAECACVRQQGGCPAAERNQTISAGGAACVLMLVDTTFLQDRHHQIDEIL
jgi:hypothetical protein